MFNINNLSFNYFGGYTGINSISFLEETNSVFILGKKSSGKSTLLKCIAGVEKCTGSIMINNVEYSSIPIKDRDFSYTFSINSLDKNSILINEIIKPLVLRRLNINFDKIDNLLNRYDLLDKKNTKIKDLTNDEKAKAIICRMLTRNSKLYLLDNPLEFIQDKDKIYSLLMQDLKDKLFIYATDNINEIAKDKKIGILSYSRLVEYDYLTNINVRPKCVDSFLFLNNNVCIEEIQLQKEDEYYFMYNGEKIITKAPISDIYVKENVLVPIINGIIQKQIYFDKETELVVSKE